MIRGQSTIYRKIDVRVWGDFHFRNLSRAAPNAQTMWFYLLTGPQTTAFPGLFRAPAGMIADDLRWPAADVERILRELETAKPAGATPMLMRDPETGVIFLPAAMRYNRPESPNVIRAWGKSVRQLPESPIVARACAVAEEFLAGFGEGFRQAFREAFGEGFRQPFANQEQEQKQKQDLIAAAAPCVRDADEAPAVAPDAPHETKSPEPPSAMNAPDPLVDFLAAQQIKPFAGFPWTSAPSRQWAAMQRCSFPELDAIAEAQKAVAWCASNPTRAPRKNARRFLNSWFARAEDNRRGAPAGILGDAKQHRVPKIPLPDAETLKREAQF